MISIEFIGAPGSGKTYYKKKLVNFLLKKNLKTFNFSTLFYEKYPVLYKTSLANYFFFKSKKILNTRKNYFLRLLNYNFDKFINFNEEYEKINQNLYNKKFLEKYFFYYDKFYDEKLLKNKLKKWLCIELAGLYLSKKIRSNKDLLINSEGINQRILRLIIKDKKKNLLKNLNYSYFESDIIIFVNTNNKICSKRLKKRINVNYSEKDLKAFYEGSKFLFKKSKKKKYIISKEINLKEVFTKIYDNINIIK